MNAKQREVIAKAIKTPLCNIGIFSNVKNALSFSSHAVKLSPVMHVNDEYWVVSMAEAARLEKLGYKWT